MERLIRFFVERHMLVHVITAVIIVVGYIAATRSPRETFPDIFLPNLMVRAILPGASPEDVETKITIPLEEAIEKLDGVEEFETIVTESMSNTTIKLFDDYTLDDLDEAEKDLRALIEGIKDFPSEMEDDPVIMRFETKRFPVVQVALGGPTDGVIEAAELLKRKIRRLENVSRVETIGLADPEMRVLIDPDRAIAHNVTLLDVARAIERRNVSSTGGALETVDDRQQVVLWSRFSDPADVGDTILRFDRDGGRVRVTDVARLELGREDTKLRAHTNGEPGIKLIVVKRANADILNTVDEVRELIDETRLPAGVTGRLILDESYWTRNRLALMANNGIVGAILIVGALLVFLTPTVSFWVLIGIPVVFLSVLIAFIWLDLTINIVTLTGLLVVLGMVVDDAVVVAERIVAKRQGGLSQDEAAAQGASEIARPVIASAVTTMLAFLPLAALGGMAGRMTASMPVVVVLALLMSVLESFLILPAHMSMAGEAAAPPRRKFMLRLEASYRRGLERTLAHRGLVVGGFVLTLLVIFIFIAPLNRVVLFPNDDAEQFLVKISTPLGTPIERTEAVATSIERQLPDIVGSDLDTVVAEIGHQDALGEAGFRERGAAPNEAVVMGLFKRGGLSRPAPEWIPEIEEKLVVPNDTTLVLEIGPAGPPMGMPVQVHVGSNDDEKRRAATLEVSRYLGAITGVTNIEVDERPGTRKLDLNLDYDRLALRDLEAKDVALTLQGAFLGIPASEHRDLDDSTEFRVMLEPDARSSLDSLLRLPVRTRSGELATIRDVVRPVEVDSVSRIYHRDGLRTATVRAGFAPDSPHTSLSLALRIERELLPRFTDDHIVDVYLGGEAVESRRTTGDMPLATLVALAGIALTIGLMLGSLLEAFFVMSIIPFAVAAVILVFFLHNQPLTLFAMMGTLGLSGVVVNSSIVMVDAIHRLTGSLTIEERGRSQDLVIDAVVGRLRPILVTTITTLGGVLPTAYGIGGYDSLVAPISLAIGWGLGVSTIVTLFLVPTLYTLASDLRLAVSRLRSPKEETVHAPFEGSHSEV